MDPKGEFHGLPVGIYSNILNAQWETKTNIKELEKLLVYPLQPVGRQVDSALFYRTIYGSSVFSS